MELPALAGEKVPRKLKNSSNRGVMLRGVMKMKNDNSQTAPASKPAPHPGMDLPKLISQAELKKTIANDPIGAIEKLVRTPEELSEAIDSLTSGPMRYEPNQIEALTLWIIEYSHTSKEAEEIIRWYGLCEMDANFDPRSDFEFIRAFRFLMEDDIEDSRLHQVLFGLHCRPWFGTVINDMVRRNPWLYWCHKQYQDGIARTLDEFAKRDNSKPYSDRDWQGVERCIRRVVEAGDWSLSKQVHDIYRLHKEGKLEIDTRSGEGRDPFTPNRIKAFLEDAVGFLAKQRNADTTSFTNDFARALEVYGNFTGKVFVEIICPNEILIPKEDLGPSKFSVKISAEHADESVKLSDMLARVSLELEIEGGYFPATDGRNERMAFLKKNTGAIGEYEFYFIPFEGRGRLSLTLLYRDKDSLVESFTNTSRHFFEAKAAADSQDNTVRTDAEAAETSTAADDAAEQDFLGRQ